MAFTIYDVKRLEQEHKLFTDAYTVEEVMASYPFPGKAVVILSCLIRSTDTVDRLLTLWSYIGEAGWAPIVTVNIPALSGSDGIVPAVDLPGAIVTTPAGLLLAMESVIFGYSMPVKPSTGKHIRIATVFGLF